jgi:hypothetical protein
MTMGQLASLAALADSKGLARGPWQFYGPMMEVADETEMLRLHHVDVFTALPGGYAIRRDTMKAYQLIARPYSQLTSWQLTSIPVFPTTSARDGAFPTPSTGTAAVVSTGDGQPTLWIYRGTGSGWGWRQGRVQFVLTDIRRTILELTTQLRARPMAGTDRFCFLGPVTLPPNNDDSSLAVSREDSVFVVDAGKLTFHDGPLKLAKLSYISSEAATVRTVLKTGSILGEITESTATHQRAIWKVRLVGSWPGTLQTTLRYQYQVPVGNTTAPTFTLLNTPALTYDHEVVQLSARVWEGRWHIDSLWAGEELVFDLRVEHNPGQDQGLTNWPFATELRAASPQGLLYIVESDGGISTNTIGVGYETVAASTPDPESSDENVREGMRLEAWRSRGASFAFPWNGVADWERQSGVHCQASVRGGMWRAQPIGLLAGYNPDPRYGLPGVQILAPKAELGVTGMHDVSSSAVQLSIPRIPFRRTTDTPNFIFLQAVEGEVLSLLPRGHVVRELLVSRKPTGDPAVIVAGTLDLSVQVGYIDRTAGNVFRALTTVIVPAGQLHAARIYPGWAILDPISLCYQATEAADLQAMCATGFGYGIFRPPVGSGNPFGINITQLLKADVSGTPISAFQYNDTEGMLTKL